MPCFDVTIDHKTYHVDIPLENVQPLLQLIVNGQPFELCLGEEVALRKPQMAGGLERGAEPGTMVVAPCKTVKAEWHAAIYPE